MGLFRFLPIITLVVSACGGPDETAATNGLADPVSATPVNSLDIGPDLAGIHDRVITLDTHVDIPFNFATAEVDPLDGDLQVNLQKMRSGGLDAAFFIVYVGQTERTPDNYAKAQSDAMTKFNAIQRMTDELYPDRIGFAYTPADFNSIAADGRLIATIGIENGYVIGTDLALLGRYFDLGARYMTLVHNGHNDIADSAQPRPQFGDSDVEHGGVSDFGAEVIARMNELGMMVDVSHASKTAALEAISLSKAPVIASHSSVSGIADHPRNMDDETLLALRDNGGVIQIVAFSSYLKSQPPARETAMRELRERLGLADNQVDPSTVPESSRIDYLRGIRDILAQWPDPTVTDLVDHIDYAVARIGIEHVGISSDFGGGGGVLGWTDATETLNVTAELLRRGYSEEQIAKLWSGNLLRVWTEVEAYANVTD